MGRIARSWALTKQSYGVLMQDKKLILLPVMSGAAILVICSAFVFGLGLLEQRALQGNRIGALLPVLLIYIISYTTAFFFQAALIAGACERMAGRNPTLGTALAAASRRFGAILTWGVVAGTVGMLLRAIQERSKLVGKIVIALLGTAWSLATFFMVPVLVMEQQTVPGSFKRSAALFKKNWGESVSGNVSIGLIGIVIMLPLCLVAALLGAVSPVAAALIVVPLIAVAGAFLSALQGVFLASVYRYATTGETTAGYDPELFASAFKPKRPAP